MKTKTIVIGCLALVLLGGAVVACAVGGIFFLGLNEDAQQDERAGIEFGKRTDQLGCKNEALRRLLAATKSGNFIKRSESEYFLYGCFQTSRSTPDFCANVPKDDNALTVYLWSLAQCRELGAGNDDACANLITEVSNVCLGKTKRRGQ